MHLWLRKDFPIWRDAEQLLLEIEKAVRRFARRASSTTAPRFALRLGE